MTRRVLRGLSAAALLSGAVLFLSVVPTAGGVEVGQRGPSHGDQLLASATTSESTCPSGDTCVNIPGTSKESLKGGTVDASPTSDLGPNQWVYLNGLGFAATTHLRIEYCSDTKALPTPPVCVSKATESIAQGYVASITFSTGTFQQSLQVEQDSTPTNPIAGTVAGTTPAKPGTFLCDASTPCSIDVVDLGNGQKSDAPTPDNTAVIPVTFVPSSTGCPGAKIVSTKSEFGMEQVLPIAARISCATSDPAIAFNVAQDGDAAVTALETGSVSVAFTDDPQSSDQQALLSKGNYKLIPVALTANVVAFHAQELSPSSGNLYPLFHFDLTPTMAAGLLTGAYGYTKDTDLVQCPTSTCPTPPCTPPLHKTTPPLCSLMIQLNYSEGFSAPSQYGSFVRSDAAGSNGLFFAWVCDAPKVAVPVKVVDHTAKHDKTVPYTATYTETITAAHEVEYAYSSKDTQSTECPATTETYPKYPATSHGALPASFATPDQQDLKMVAYITGKNWAAFGTMNWAEARYYGLAVASIQNADGQFEAPTQTSLDAAVTGGNPTVDADGALSPDYTKAETGVYPMASIEYAAVCGDKTTTTKADATKAMLDQLLTLTGAGGGDTSQLPEGFVPLPSTIVQDARSDITKDVVGGAKMAPMRTTTACPSVTPGTPAATTTSATATQTTTSSTSTTTSTTNGNGAASSAAQTPAPQSPAQTSVSQPSTTTGTRSSPAPATSTQPITTPSTAPPTTKTAPGPSGRKRRTSNLPVILVALASLGSRMLLPLAAVLALLGLLFGGALVLSQPFRRHVAAAVGAVRRGVWGFLTSSSQGRSTKFGRGRQGRPPW